MSEKYINFNKNDDNFFLTYKSLKISMSEYIIRKIKKNKQPKKFHVENWTSVGKRKYVMNLSADLPIKRFSKDERKSISNLFVK